MCCSGKQLTLLQCLQGGKLTSPDQADIVQLVQMGKKQLLWYKALAKVHAALLRGTTADLDGNISFEKEALYLDSLNMVRGCTLLVRLMSFSAFLSRFEVMGWLEHLQPPQPPIRPPPLWPPPSLSLTPSDSFQIVVQVT